VLIWIYYLFRSTIIAHPVLAANQGIIFFLHPLAVALIFLLTLIIHPAHKAKVIRTPLWYVSSGVFLYFLGYMIMAYSFIKPVAKLIPLLYTTLLFLSSAYFALGLFAASKKFGESEKAKQSAEQGNDLKTQK
jgi:glucan phosphoethanolaminetransferase (alkaline phosphatase superfamily)